MSKLFIIFLLDISKMAASIANSPRGFHVQYVDDIAILVLNNTENRFNQNSTEQIINALDIVERYQLFLLINFLLMQLTPAKTLGN